MVSAEVWNGPNTNLILTGWHELENACRHSILEVYMYMYTSTGDLVILYVYEEYNYNYYVKQKDFDGNRGFSKKKISDVAHVILMVHFSHPL